MNTTIRRIIFFGFVTLFFLVAVVLLIYANGYRYHLGKNTIEKTGQLLVETQPKGAELLLNGAPATSQWSRDHLTTPATVPYLFSGQYRLTVSRKGFHDWSGDVTVFPGRTTIKNDIVLLKSDPPTLISAQPSIRSAKEFARGVMFDDGKSIYFFNNQSEQVSLLYTSPTPLLDVIPAPSGTRVVVKNSDGWRVIQQGRSVATIKQTKKQSPEFRWAQNNDALYMLDEKGISVFDENILQFTPFIEAPHIVDCFIDDEIVALMDDTYHPAIIFFDMRTGSQTRELASIPTATKIWGTAHGFLVLENGQDSLYLFDRNAVRPVFQHVEDVKDIVFLNEHHFITSNDFEIWNHDFSNDHYTKVLVTRQSQQITQILPLATEPFMVMVFDKKDIHIRDLRSTDTVSSDTLLSSFTSVVAVFFDTKKTTLFVIGSRGGRSGIFSQPIIEREQLFPLVK